MKLTSEHGEKNICSALIISYEDTFVKIKEGPPVGGPQRYFIDFVVDYLCYNIKCVILNALNSLQQSVPCLRIKHLDEAVWLIKRRFHQDLYIFDIAVVFNMVNDLQDELYLLLIK